MQVVAGVRRMFGGASVTVVARHRIADWLASRGVIDRAVDFESAGLHGLFGDDPVPPSVSLAGFDLTLNFVTGATDAFALNLARIVGGRVCSIHPAVREATLSAGRHVTAQWIDDLRVQGVRVDYLSANVPPIAKAGAALSACARRMICHPGAGGRAKCAPIEVFEGWVAVAVSRGLDACWMIGPTEREWFGQSFVDRLQRSARVIEEADVCDAASRLCEADVFVGNDSGMSHLAAAIGLRTVVFFGPTDSPVWSPLGPDVHVRVFPVGEGDHLEVINLLASSVAVNDASLRANR